jgi:NAD(P)H-dependent flavin oxidoreductase YrpB (nitropropane dioxygenase family)
LIRSHKDAVLRCGDNETVRTEIYTGRPLRVIKTDYIMDWEKNRKEEMKKLLGRGILPYKQDIEDKIGSGFSNRPCAFLTCLLQAN